MILDGDPPISITMKRSARARRMTLRVSRLDGRVTLSLPTALSERKARNFIHEKQDWIRRQLSAQPELVTVGLGATLPIEGDIYRVEEGAGRLRCEADALILPRGRGATGKRVATFLKHLARDRLAEHVDHCARQIGRSVGEIALRDTRSRWGSCSSEGRLMFSWRLIMAPPEALRYVAAHEVAHLLEMNHSPAFWAVVDKLHPGWQAERDWLRINGPDLHRYRFAD